MSDRSLRIEEAARRALRYLQIHKNTCAEMENDLEAALSLPPDDVPRSILSMDPHDAPPPALLGPESAVSPIPSAPCMDDEQGPPFDSPFDQGQTVTVKSGAWAGSRFTFAGYENGKAVCMSVRGKAVHFDIDNLQ